MNFGFLIFVEWAPSQHEITTQLDHPSLIHLIGYCSNVFLLQRLCDFLYTVQ